MSDLTRCVCGLEDEGGTMIQCEECGVWQHCDCMGLVKIPKHYYCEGCRPIDHPYFLMLTKQANKSKRNTMASREAEQSMYELALLQPTRGRKRHKLDKDQPLALEEPIEPRQEEPLETDKKDEELPHSEHNEPVQEPDPRQEHLEQPQDEPMQQEQQEQQQTEQQEQQQQEQQQEEEEHQEPKQEEEEEHQEPKQEELVKPKRKRGRPKQVKKTTLQDIYTRIQRMKDFLEQHQEPESTRLLSKLDRFESTLPPP